MSLTRVHLHQVVLDYLMLTIFYSSIFLDATLYSPNIPASLVIPSGGICGDEQKILLVGTVPEDSKDYPEIIITGPNDTEALHIKIGVIEEVVWRWAVVTDVPVSNVGTAGDGTTIDFDEPFMIT